MAAQINLPRILTVGGGARHQLPETLAALGVRRAFLVIDPFAEAQPWASELIALMRAKGSLGSIFTGVVPDPTTDSVSAAVESFAQYGHDAVVAIGGGSAMDTAKVVAVMAGRTGLVRDYKVPHVITAGLPVIAIPTTAGTGSEVTRVAVITDTQTQEKMLLMGLGLMPVAALVDYELSLTMPYRLTADSGIDSLCHAMEAYVSRKHNAFSDSVALASMATICQHLPVACAEPENHQAREAMMFAATQGGMAFSNASVTLIHGMSRPIGAFFHVPHGLSNAMLMPGVTQWSLSGNESRYADCARAMGFASHADSDKQANVKLIDGLSALCQQLSVPGPRAYGIAESHWRDKTPVMAEQALASGSPANNPRIPMLSDIVGLYDRVWASGLV